jgi:hypothetical protein
MLFSGTAFKLFIVAAVGIAGFVAGIKLEGNRWRAKEATRLEAMLKERQVDEAFTLGVSSAYEQVAAQLRRMTTVNRVEIQREVQRVEYRCPLPEGGLSLLNQFVDDSNRMRGLSANGEGSSASKPNDSMRPSSEGAGERLGGVSNSLFGTDGEVR